MYKLKHVLESEPGIFSGRTLAHGLALLKGDFPGSGLVGNDKRRRKNKNFA